MQQLRNYHVIELQNAAGSLCNFSHGTCAIWVQAPVI
jgi:hypothetical protein